MSVALLRRALGRPPAVVALVLIIAAAASDFATGFWVTHPMSAGLVGGLVMLAFALAIVDELRAQVESQRWSRVANICLKSLAQTAASSRDSLAFLRDGMLRFPDEYVGVTWFSFEVTAARDELVERGVREPTVDQLMQSAAWVSAAYTSLRATSGRIRTDIARWAPLMIDSARLCSAVQLVGHLSDAVEDLHRPLGPIQRVEGVVPQTERREKTERVFVLALEYSVMLEERLTHVMGRTGWRTRGRELLSDASLIHVERLGIDDGLERIALQLREARDDLRALYPAAYVVALQRASETDAPG